MARPQIPFPEQHLPVTDKPGYAPLYVLEFQTHQKLLLLSSREMAIPFALGGAGGEGAGAGDEGAGAGAEDEW